MKEKMFLGIMGGITVMATSIPIYNYYVLPIVLAQIRKQTAQISMKKKTKVT
jgi:hypothetical protein